MNVELGFAAAQWTAVRHFYTHVLGLPELNESDRGRTLRLVAGEQRIDLVPIDPWEPAAPSRHLALLVRNLDSVRAKLLAGGFSLDDTRALPGHLRVYVSDPAGNAIELLEPLRAYPA